jgi:hypothetical protein
MALGLGQIMAHFPMLIQLSWATLVGTEASYQKLSMKIRRLHSTISINLYKGQKRHVWGWEVAQVVEHLPNKHRALRECESTYEVMQLAFYFHMQNQFM